MEDSRQLSVKTQGGCFQRSMGSHNTDIRYDPKVGLVAKARSWPDQPQLVNGAVLAYGSKTYTHNDQTLPKKAAQANLIPEIQGEHKCCAFEQVQEAVGS